MSGNGDWRSRRRKADDVRLDRCITVRIRRQTYDRLQEKADGGGRKLADFVRDRLEEEARDGGQDTDHKNG